MDNISSLRGITPEVASAPVHLFEVAPALRQFRLGRTWSHTSSVHTAKNPPGGVMIEYHLAQVPKGEVTLAITELNGKLIQQFSSGSEKDLSPTKRAGMNRFLWDMQYPSIQLPPVAGALAAVPDLDRWHPAPPVAPPGRYLVRLTVDGLAFEQPFEIRMDPRTKASDADLGAQFEFMVAIQMRLSEAIAAVSKIREIRGQLGSRQTDRHDRSRVATNRVLEQLREIEGTLMRWMGSQSHPMMWDAPGLIDKFSRLSNVVVGTPKPTNSMHKLFADLSDRLEVQRNRLNRIIAEEVGPMPTR
jgi:hypothetical protein